MEHEPTSEQLNLDQMPSSMGKNACKYFQGLREK